jgi:hypothetical protein
VANTLLPSGIGMQRRHTAIVNALLKLDTLNHLIPQHNLPRLILNGQNDIRHVDEVLGNLPCGGSDVVGEISHTPPGGNAELRPEALCGENVTKPGLIPSGEVQYVASCRTQAIDWRSVIVDSVLGIVCLEGLCLNCVRGIKETLPPARICLLR